jgi:hypothetical protein
MRKLPFPLFLAALLASMALLLPSISRAQPSAAVEMYPVARNTYAASVVGFTPAASATDFLVLQGSATKKVILRSANCTGTSTAAGSTVVSVTERSTANSGGTAGTAPTIVALSPSDPAATATVAYYTANPTLGTSAGIVSVGLVQTVAPASDVATLGNVPTFNYTYNPVGTIGIKPPSISGVASSFALNAGATSFATGAALSCTVVWTED